METNGAGPSRARGWFLATDEAIGDFGFILA
jgi:hypothetical protein